MCCTAQKVPNRPKEQAAAMTVNKATMSPYSLNKTMPKTMVVSEQEENLVNELRKNVSSSLKMASALDVNQITVERRHGNKNPDEERIEAH